MWQRLTTKATEGESNKCGTSAVAQDRHGALPELVVVIPACSDPVSGGEDTVTSRTRDSIEPAVVCHMRTCARLPASHERWVVGAAHEKDRTA